MLRVPPPEGLGFSYAPRQTHLRQGISPPEQYGAAFRVALPDSLRRILPAPPAVLVTRLSARILCVDDDLAVRDRLVEQLRRFGLYPLVVSSGREALRIVGSEPIDVCVLNFQIADMKGESLAGELRRLAPKISLVMTSGAPTLPHNALKLVDRFVTKDSWFERKLISEIISILGARGRAASA